MSNTKRNGFTLIELMIVIAILAILTALLSGNFLSSLQKGRDAKRKADLHQMQQALELFYQDKKQYPDLATFTFGNKFCETSACASGEEIYMVKLPTDPQNKSGTKYAYCVSADKSSYQMYARIENTQDSQALSSLSASVGTCGPSGACSTGISLGGSTTRCNYGVSSSNATP